MEHEPVSRIGKYYEIRVPWIPLATFMVVEVLAIDENNNVRVEDMIPVMEGDSLAHRLEGWSLMEAGRLLGKNMGILFNPAEVVKYPEDSKYEE